MKTIYINDFYYMLTFNDNTCIRSFFNGRPIYQYGELPEIKRKEYNDKNAFYELANLLNTPIHRKFLTGREYINDCCFNKIIFKDDLKSFEAINDYKIIEKPNISHLENDLGFYKYSELVFDREMELRTMLK